MTHGRPITAVLLIFLYVPADSLHAVVLPIQDVTEDVMTSPGFVAENWGSLNVKVDDGTMTVQGNNRLY